MLTEKQIPNTMVTVQRNLNIDYIECLFIGEGKTLDKDSAISGTKILAFDVAAEHVARQLEKGVTKFLVFGVPAVKSIKHATTDSYCVRHFLEITKQLYGERVTLMADVGLSPYQSSGQSIVYSNERVDETASYLAACELSLAFAASGADYVAPCLSLPKQVERIKSGMRSNGFETRIMSYSTKFSSSLYGPYRQTIMSNLGLVRKDYQSDYADCSSALSQMADDILQQADIVMVKPAIHYLDVVLRAKNISKKPVAAYHVSGEYMMAKLAAEAGLIDEAEYFDEVHSSLHRAGADLIIGYAVEHFVRWKQALPVSLN